MKEIRSPEYARGAARIEDRPDLVLGLSGNAVTRRGETWYTHHSLGRIVEMLALHVRAIQYHAPLADGSAANACDFPLQARNLFVRAWPNWRNSLNALRRPDRLLMYYWQLTRESNCLFLRGSGPLIWTAHWMAWAQGKRSLHWVVGNPLALIRAAPRGYGSLLDGCGVAYAWLEQNLLRMTLRGTGAGVLANGSELARIFRTPRTVQVVSSSVDPADFSARDTACTGAEIRLLFVGFIRPEKGLEYLIRALPQIGADKPLRLAIVGSWEQFEDEHQKLSALAARLGVADRVSWEGYAAFGPTLHAQMDASDILVLPSLSEGTPRVLVEARARGLPVVSTHVGGIPSSVTDGVDGLLVPPRDPAALASAIKRLIVDTDLRKRLQKNGRKRVADLTVDRFVGLVLSTLGNLRKPEKV